MLTSHELIVMQIRTQFHSLARAGTQICFQRIKNALFFTQAILDRNCQLCVVHVNTKQKIL